MLLSACTGLRIQIGGNQWAPSDKTFRRSEQGYPSLLHSPHLFVSCGFVCMYVPDFLCLWTSSDYSQTSQHLLSILFVFPFLFVNPFFLWFLDEHRGWCNTSMMKVDVGITGDDTMQETMFSAIWQRRCTFGGSHDWRK
jgi:hypothetical protein